ncbi:NUDIX domain-containing protein [Saccharibacillus sp. CPCC 101409]|uniref:NUDIX domain-containing protein n=1 Tax=Saccharibacillus sp. CPCC 101409 TaxID=3058041 RepID=UPI002672E219|nr:NUDIX domain-containing protein [Saccharibacillus sp. CPCC 101409]MDO3413196.1 NUDIX domain-containing protein [Saccharibacillus sp. CPCC 101409]
MTIIVGTGAVIRNEDDRVLLVLRRKDPESGKWSIPGGKVDPFETLESAVVREVEEETGLTVEVESLLCTDEIIQPQHDRHLLSLIYKVRYTGGEPVNREPQKHAELRWFKPGELPPESEIAAFSREALRLVAAE